MKKERKAELVEEIAAQITKAEAIYAVDYRGLSVTQAASLRSSLREAGASFRIVKNTLTLRAADKSGAEHVKALLEGPTALTFVRGDPALAAKALDSFARAERLLEFRGGILAGEPVTSDAVRALARLPAREQLNAQFAGVVAAPLTGLVRGLGSLLSGLAIALGQVRDMKPAEPAAETAEGAQPAEAEAPAAGAEEPASETEVPAAQAEEGGAPPAEDAAAGEDQPGETAGDEQDEQTDEETDKETDKEAG